MSLKVVPLTLDEANEFVLRHHRHHKKVAGHKFSLGAQLDGAARAAMALGYARIGTYILASETGASLRAAGWRLIAKTPGKSWSVPSRARVDKHPLEPKLLFER
jgi:hypothetical protein